MGPDSFAMAARLYWVGTDGYPDLQKMDRYFRVHYGAEAFEWNPLTGISVITQDSNRGKNCEYDDFKVASNIFDQYNLSKAICPSK